MLFNTVRPMSLSAFSLSFITRAVFFIVVLQWVAYAETVISVAAGFRSVAADEAQA
jgi:hypothetical protein